MRYRTHQLIRLTVPIININKIGYSINNNNRMNRIIVEENRWIIIEFCVRSSILLSFELLCILILFTFEGTKVIAMENK